MKNCAGTGTNSAYVEHVSNLGLRQLRNRGPSMAINTEWGNFGCRTEDGTSLLDPILTEIDYEIDKQSLNPGDFTFLTSDFQSS